MGDAVRKKWYLKAPSNLVLGSKPLRHMSLICRLLKLGSCRDFLKGGEFSTGIYFCIFMLMFHLYLSVHISIRGQLDNHFTISATQFQCLHLCLSVTKQHNLVVVSK